MRHDVPDVVAKLQAEGGPTQIADFLRDEGVVGTPRSSGCCAIANYLRQVTGRDNVLVDIDVITYGRKSPLVNGRICLDEVLIANTPVSEFVAAFDRGEFRDLVEDGAT